MVTLAEPSGLLVVNAQTRESIILAPTVTLGLQPLKRDC